MLRFLFFICSFFIFGIVSSQSPDAELLLQQTDITVNNGKVIRNHLYVVRVNRREGDEYASVSIPYSKMRKLSKVDAALKDGNGKVIRKLSRADITERSAFTEGTFYRDFFLKEFTLRHHQYPFIIEYSYQEEESEFFYIENWIPVLDREIPTRTATLNLEVPADYKIAFSTRFTENPVLNNRGPVIRYSWSTAFDGIRKSEESMPSFRRIIPNLMIVPEIFTYDVKGSQESWISLGDWQYDLIKDLNDLPFKEKSIITNLVKGINSESEKIRVIYHYLQDNTRYINVTIETGGLKPYPASYVAENKFGDCKALTFFMKSLLEAAGIKSFYTLVNAGEIIELPDTGFHAQQFNHVILCVPTRRDTIWLDCTSKLAFNYLGTFTQGRPVLLIDEGKSHFIKTPSLTSEEVINTRKIRFSYSPSGKNTFQIENKYRGGSYEEIHYLNHTVSEPGRTQYLRNNFVEKGFNATALKISEAPRDSAFIQLDYSGEVSGNYSAYGDEILLRIHPFVIPDFEKPEERKIPVQLNYPVCLRDSLEYEIPGDYVISGIVPNKTISGKYGEYKADIVTSDKHLYVVKSFVLFPGFITLAEYAGFYNFISEAGKSDRGLKVLFKHM